MANRQVQAGRISQRTGGRSIPSNVLGPTEPADVLAVEKAKRIDQLWSACDAYERQFFSGGIHAQMLEIKLRGGPGATKAIRNQHWILGLWRDYYTRRDLIESYNSTVDVRASSLDFGQHGRPPFTVREMLQDAPIV